jgi:hypothetical protein
MENPTSNLDSYTSQEGGGMSDALGENFEYALLPPLFFSTKSRIWGDRSGKACEPMTTAFVAPGFKQSALLQHTYTCHFCGFTSRLNEVHNLNDNHDDVRGENLRAADLLCHKWQHLGELDIDDAAVAYLPGLSPQDINHLQRTIMVALQSDDANIHSDAKALLNWLASHRDYAKRAWGTYDPAVFADAMVRQPFNERDFREIVFDGLGVILNPRLCASTAAGWLTEAYAPYPTANWASVYHDVMNAPL